MIAHPIWVGFFVCRLYAYATTLNLALQVDYVLTMRFRWYGTYAGGASAMAPCNNSHTHLDLFLK